jgi:signal transduction histidine kinase
MGDDLGAGSVPPVRGDGALRLGFAGLSARGWILLAEAASLPLAVPALGLLILLLVGWPLSLAGVGLLLVHLAVPLAAALARWRRDLINRLGRHLPGNYYHDLTFAEVSYRKAGPRQPIRPWDRAVAGPLIWLRDPARWRDLGFLAFTSSAGFTVSVLVVSLPANVATHLILAIVTGKPWWIGLLGPDLALWWLLTPVLARARIRAEQRIFEGSRASRLESRVEAVTTSRAETIDHSSTELRRIERDLHDGAQARIVSAGMYRARRDADPR